MMFWARASGLRLFYLEREQTLFLDRFSIDTKYKKKFKILTKIMDYPL